MTSLSNFAKAGHEGAKNPIRKCEKPQRERANKIARRRERERERECV